MHAIANFDRFDLLLCSTYLQILLTFAHPFNTLSMRCTDDNTQPTTNDSIG